MADPLNTLRAWARPFVVRATAKLLAPVDIASLAYVRIAFGLIMFWDVWRYLENDWIKRYYIDPGFHFTYWGFGWVAPLPGNAMYLFFAAMAAVSVAFALGYRYRVTAPLMFLGISYWYLLDTARYLNHVYLTILIALVMMLVPADRVLSMDVAAGRVARTDSAPTWALWIVRFQIAVVYIFGGIAKLGGDWLAGAPMTDWLAARDDFPLIGQWFHEVWMIRFFTYGGMLFDFTIVPLLLWRRTRWFAFGALVFFHASNDILWNIGIFPWLGIHTATIFFEPDWPRRLLAKVGVTTRRMPAPPRASLAPSKAVAVVVLLLVAYNVAMPLRHHAYEGNVDWTDEGHRYAWRMKLRDKDATATFLVTDPILNETWEFDAGDELASWQESAMESRPDMIHQFALHLAKKMREERGHEVEVRAEVVASLHGRPSQFLIDPTVDLASMPWSLAKRDWIVPLEHAFAPDNQDPS